MTPGWPDIWTAVREAVRTSRTRSQALAKVSELRGPTSWDALARAWRRQVDAGLEEGEAHTSLGQQDPRRDWSAFMSSTQGRAIGKALWEAAEEEAKPEPAGRKILVIPDTQVEPGVPLDHFTWLGRYIAEKGPDVVVHMGDHWDMPSLSAYESAVRKAARGVIKKLDIDSGNQALEMLEDELTKANFQPKRKVLLEGNHDGFADEGRVGRYLAEHPQDEGLITRNMFADYWLGWERVPFLEPIEVGGISFCHLFPFNAQGRVSPSGLRMGATSARVQTQALMTSTVAGHRPGLDQYIHYTPHRTFRGLIAGSFYQHSPPFLGPSRYWRGVLMLHDVRQSNPNHFDVMEVSMEFLRRKYG